MTQLSVPFAGAARTRRDGRCTSLVSSSAKAAREFPPPCGLFFFSRTLAKLRFAARARLLSVRKIVSVESARDQRHPDGRLADLRACDFLRGMGYQPMASA